MNKFPLKGSQHLLSIIKRDIFIFLNILLITSGFLFSMQIGFDFSDRNESIALIVLSMSLTAMAGSVTYGLRINKGLSLNKTLSYLTFILIYLLMVFSVNEWGENIISLLKGKEFEFLMVISGIIIVNKIYNISIKTENINFKKIKNKPEIITATHEVGHAIFNLGLNNLPNDFEINIKGNRRSHGFVRTISESQLELSRDKVWYMYMLLGGTCAEKYYFRDNAFGSKSDLRRWESLAIDYLTHSTKVHYYTKPKNNLELKHNNKLLSRLKSIQIKNIYTLFNKNKKLMDILIKELMDEKIIKKEGFLKYSESINWHDKIPKVNI